MSTSPEPAPSDVPLTELLSVAVIAADPAGQATFANWAWTVMTGQAESDWNGHGWYDVLDKHQGVAARLAMISAVAAGVVYEADWTTTHGGDARILHVVAIPEQLRGRTVRFVATVADVTEDRMQADRLGHLATHDHLTGLYNRTAFAEFVSQALIRLQRAPNGRVAILFVDVDGLKATNDSLGHDAGDRLLRLVASRIVRAVRSRDVVARYGGDEFTVLCEDLPRDGDADALAARIARVVGATHNGDTACSVSIGVAFADDAAMDGATLLAAADRAMYRNRLSARSALNQIDRGDGSEVRPRNRGTPMI